MDEAKLGRLLDGLSAQSGAINAGPDFCDGVWQRVGEMSEAREQRRRTILGLAFFAVGLGAGMGVTQRPAHAEGADYALTTGADLSPSALLHIAP